MRLQYIGKINPVLFKDISKNIITDEVVLTDKQREHIEQRHPKTLEKYGKHLKSIIENPDFIMKDNTRSNTALIFKTVNDNEIEGNLNIVLRLAVEGDDIENKNSIITCIPIGSSRMKSYLRNGKIVYNYLYNKEKKCYNLSTI